MKTPKRPAPKTKISGKSAEDLPRATIAQLVRKTLLDHFSPAAVVIDSQQRIVYFHGHTDRYFDQPSGKSTQKILSVVRKPLVAVTRSAILHAVAQKKPHPIQETITTATGEKLPLEVFVVPLPAGAAPTHYLVGFSEHSGNLAGILTDKRGTSSHQRLQQELQQTRNELQSTIVELQESNGQVKAAHEEIISFKEKLQSLNEELTTVNSQLQVKMEELESSTNDMNSLLRSTDIAALFLDPELRIRRYTPAVKDLFELIPADTGRRLSDLALQFDDPTLLQDARNVLNDVSLSEREVVSNSGRTYVRRVLPYRKHDSAVEGVVLTFIDMSARKEAELEMRANQSRHQLILSGIKEYGIFVLNLQGRFTTWTAGAERILGYTEKEALGQHLNLILTEEDRAAGLAEKDLVRATSKGDVTIERWHARKDGSRFWGTGTLSLLNDEHGHPYGFVKVVRDNTDRKLAEDELRNAMINAEAANSSKDHFLANVSHELRTPLAATLLWSKLLSEQTEIDPELLQEGLSAINRSSKEQQALIEDLMDTAKIVAGKMSLERRNFDLVRLIQTILPPLRSLAAEKQLVIEEILGDDVGTVAADPRRIQQVISNLVNNAIEFTPNGGRIRVRAERKGDDVTIQVSDTGKGISKEFLSRIFDRFVQIDQGSTPTASGMGLGLAIARQLVELHEGTIRAESAGKDHGTTFTIILPLLRRPALPEDAPVPERSIPSLKGSRILLVEDTPDTRLALETVLTEAGAKVVAVGTAKDALEKFERNPPDFILSDIGLDNGNSGHQLLAEIRKRENEKNLVPVPALALTAYADEKNRHKAFESGFQDCITKPIEPERLIVKLANLRGKD